MSDDPTSPSASLYQTVMGESFGRLALPVQQFHRLYGHHFLQGQVEVDAPGSLLGKLMGSVLGAPVNASRGTIRFELDAGPDEEVWTRHFPSGKMRSRLLRHGRRVVEHLGAVRLVFDLLEENGALVMRLQQLRFLGVRCPGWLMPSVLAVETGDAGRFCFRVQAALPMVGLVTSYRGSLALPEKEAT